MKQQPQIIAFNRGLVSKLGLARVDQKRIAFAAEVMTNWIPRVLGSMTLRPGFGHIGATASNAAARMLDFIFSTTDTALVELTNLKARVWVDDELITRASVDTAIANGTFTSNLTSWTDDDEAGATSAWVTGGYMGLTGNGTAAAVRYQAVTVAAGDVGVEHALNIVVNRGPVTLRVGSAIDGDQYINETVLDTGYHSLSFTPTGTFYVQFQSRLKRIVYVDSCAIASAGVMELTAPWLAADLGNVRKDQSGDVLFIACEDYQQRKIERRSATSWSVVLYESEDGPFRSTNLGPITLTPSALSGNITLTASAPLFRSTHVGALMRVTSTGQIVTASAVAENQFTNAIEIASVGTGRIFTIIRAGTWVATVTLQRSLTSDTGPWEDVTTYTTNATITYDDGLDNQIAWYRIGVKTGDFTSGQVDLTLDYALGSVDGIARITAVTTNVLVSAEVIIDFGGTEATDIWAEGTWSSYRGFPTSVRFHEGRLWWFGSDNIIGSLSDSFYSFDDTVEGDSGVINRNIGAGPVDVINWGLSLQRLLIGAQGSELSVRSSSLDEPLTPTNFNLKPASTQGSAPVDAVKIDQNGVFVQRNGIKVFELSFDANGYDYGAKDLTLIVPELGLPGIVRMAVQRQPDTRLHCVRSDGTVMMAVFDRLEDVLCWLEIETDGIIEDVVVLPSQNGSTEDQVYYVVQRTINGATVRYLEKWAKETECRGATVNKQADSYILYSGVSTTSITGLSHLEGESVIVWGDGIDYSPDVSGVQTTYTVTSGAITLNTAVTSAVIGLPYTAQWKSAKIGDGIERMGISALTRDKQILNIGLIMAYVHAKGLQFGTDFDNLDDMPEIENGTTVGANTVHEDYDEQPIEFPGTWLTDARLCLQAKAPRPCTILAAIPLVDMS